MLLTAKPWEHRAARQRAPTLALAIHSKSNIYTELDKLLVRQ